MEIKDRGSFRPRGQGVKELELKGKGRKSPPQLRRGGCGSRKSAQPHYSRRRGGAGQVFGSHPATARSMKKQSRVHNPETSLTQRRELRNNLTPAEALLWTNLKNSNLEGKKFRRQHGIGPYIADFYCPECRVIIELDGAGHYDVLAQERDALRTAFPRKTGNARHTV